MTELLLRLGGQDLIVRLDPDLPADTVQCSLNGLNALLTATTPPATTFKLPLFTSGAPAKRHAPTTYQKKRPRPPRYLYAIPKATVARIRREVTDDLPDRAIFETIMVENQSALVAAKRVKLHPTSVNRIRHRLERTYNLLGYRTTKGAP